MEQLTTQFTTSSKPKVVFIECDVPSKLYESIILTKTELSKITNLNPDLIVSNDTEVSMSIDNRYKWILNTNNEGQIYNSAICTGLRGNEELISIFTPAYKIGKGIIGTYESIKNQSYENWEWIIVDDSPLDHKLTYNTINKLAQLDSRIKLYRFNKPSNGNIGEVKHRAGMLCDGFCMVELDHDDFLLEGALLEIHNAFKNPKVGFVYSDCFEWNKDSKKDVYYGPNCAFGYAPYYWTEVEGTQHSLLDAPPVNPITIRHIVGIGNHVRVWRTSVYRQVGGHNRTLRIADDYELVVKTFLVSEFVHIKKPLYKQIFTNGNNSQDVGDNRADIQTRVNSIRWFYEEKINQRFKELGIDDVAYKKSYHEFMSIEKSKVVNAF